MLPDRIKYFGSTNYTPKDFCLFVCLFATLLLQKKQERNRGRCKRKKLYWTWMELEEWLIFQAKIEKKSSLKTKPSCQRIYWISPSKQKDWLQWHSSSSNLCQQSDMWSTFDRGYFDGKPPPLPPHHLSCVTACERRDIKTRWDGFSKTSLMWLWRKGSAMGDQCVARLHL